MIGGNSTDEFLRTHDADEVMLGGGDTDPILEGIDDYLDENPGSDSENVDHQGLIMALSEEQESECSDQEDDDEAEMFCSSVDGDDDDDDALRSPFTRGSDRLQSTHGDSDGARMPASRCDSHVLVSSVSARPYPHRARRHRGTTPVAKSVLMFLRDCR